MDFSEDSITQLTCGDGVNRDIHIWAPDQPKAIMLAIHGGLAHGGDFVLPALYFKEKNWATISMDQRGHERNKRVHIASFDCYLDDLALLVEWVKHTYPGLPVVILAHSMGGLIAAHYGLKNSLEDGVIKGFVMSSPFWGSALDTPKLLLLIAGLLSFLFPKMKAPLQDFTEFLTHDRALTERIKQDRANTFRASEVSMRFGHELLKAQQYLPDTIDAWSHPLLVLISGQDRLADAAKTKELLGKIRPSLVEQHDYPNNYHENFNETNREEIFAVIAAWSKNKLGI